MKAKFFLAFLALNGLFFSTSSASAFTKSSTESHLDSADLSRTISKIVNFNPDTYSLLEMAIDRALIAQKASDAPNLNPPLAGGISAPNFVNDPRSQPTVNGQIINPNPRFRPIVEPPKRKVKRLSGVAPRSQPSRPMIEPSQQSTPKIDLPTTKKLSQCSAPTANITNSNPVDNSINSNQPKAPFDRIIKPSIPAATKLKDPKPIVTPIPQVRHFAGARG